MLGDIVWAFLINQLVTKEVHTQKEIESYGFRFIGSGIWRKAYLGPDGVTYKVDKQPDSSERYGNKSEYNVFASWRDVELPDWFKLPEMRIFANGILAAEYVGETRHHVSYDQYVELERMGFSDLHEGNIRMCDDGRIAVIDLGHSSPRS